MDLNIRKSWRNQSQQIVDLFSVTFATFLVKLSQFLRIISGDDPMLREEIKQKAELKVCICKLVTYSSSGLFSRF